LPHGRARGARLRARPRLGDQGRRRVRRHEGAREGRDGIFRTGRRTCALAGGRCRPVQVLAFPPMSAEQLLPAHEALAIEEADAWFEYLAVTRGALGDRRYYEIEPWAWARLSQRLRAVKRKQTQLRPAAA